MPTWEEIEERINNQIERERRAAEEAERAKQERFDDLNDPEMSMAEYVARRTGREVIHAEDLGSLSMEDYIKYRKQSDRGI